MLPGLVGIDDRRGRRPYYGGEGHGKRCVEFFHTNFGFVYRKDRFGLFPRGQSVGLYVANIRIFFTRMCNVSLFFLNASNRIYCQAEMRQTVRQYGYMVLFWT